MSLQGSPPPCTISTPVPALTIFSASRSGHDATHHSGIYRQVPQSGQCDVVASCHGTGGVRLTLQRDPVSRYQAEPQSSTISEHASQACCQPSLSLHLEPCTAQPIRGERFSSSSSLVDNRRPLMAVRVRTAMLAALAVFLLVLVSPAVAWSSEPQLGKLKLSAHFPPMLLLDAAALIVRRHCIR